MATQTNNITTFEIGSTYVHLCLGLSDKKNYYKIIERKGRFVVFSDRFGRVTKATVKVQNGVECACERGGKRLIFKASGIEAPAQTELRLSIDAIQFEINKINARLKTALPAAKDILLGQKQEKEASIKALKEGVK